LGAARNLDSRSVSARAKAEALIAAGRAAEACSMLAEHLHDQPGDDDGHAAFGRAALRLGDIAAAAAAFSRARDLVPSRATHHANLAGALRRLGRHAEALIALDRAVALEPFRAEFRFNRANLRRDVGQPMLAILDYAAARALSPGLAAAASNFGSLLRQLGRLGDAADQLAHATDLSSDLVEAWINRATVLLDLDQPATALSIADGGLALRPGLPQLFVLRGLAHEACGHGQAARDDLAAALHYAPAHGEAAYHLARICHAQGNLVEAGQAALHALAIIPGHAGAHQTLAAIAMDGGALDQAICHVNLASALAPDDAGVAAGFGAVMATAGRSDFAADAFARARSLDPAGTAGLANHVTLMTRLGRSDEAKALAARFRALTPGDPEAHGSAATAERGQARAEWALAHLDRALELAPENRTFRHAQAAALLTLGRAETGLRAFRQRWRVAGRPELGGFLGRDVFPQPLWSGAGLGGRRLLVWGEQGLGDELWQAGYVGGLRGLGGGIVVECDPRLAGILGRSYGWAQVCERTVPAHEAALGADVQCAMGDLALRLGVADRSAPVGYLVGDGARVSSLRRRYRSLGPGPVVGISWRSVKPRRERSFEAPLSAWGPVLSLGGVTFVSLQYGDVGDELAAAGRRYGVEIVHEAGIDGLRDVEGFVAQVAAVDVVVSIANATISAAHGVGRLCYAALKVSQDDWRFREGCAETPWLPLVRQYWQAREGEWEAVFERIARDLEHWRQKWQKAEAR
jgi:tetratricopeptide (TPR) repeat protein